MTRDVWTLNRAVALAGGVARLQARIDRQAEALFAFGGPALSDKLDTRLRAHRTFVGDQPRPLRDLFAQQLIDGYLSGSTGDQLARVSTG